jgi:anti-anti-sigma factor
MNSSINIITDENEKYSILNLSGKFVGEDETDELKRQLEGIAKVSKKNVLINFEKVTYFSSIALGILVKEDETFSINDRKMVIYNVPSFLENIFVLTKLNSILNVIPTFEKAEKIVLAN